ncbi:hypothetical protein FB567DRAFT_246985 [Paraphoma chrysanthemicola]|uniref:Uncharacterized protein n=1 Tax=Paraphoma chrysanthemicola TaxID=798071 RepID=A0A8K0VRR0_9PLEO|nr:hypothetical protein FB567DRAFT_246985 [Paraphoma chrysanthemicola]
MSVVWGVGDGGVSRWYHDMLRAFVCCIYRNLIAAYDDSENASQTGATYLGSCRSLFHDLDLIRLNSQEVKFTMLCPRQHVEGEANLAANGRTRTRSLGLKASFDSNHVQATSHRRCGDEHESPMQAAASVRRLTSCRRELRGHVVCLRATGNVDDAGINRRKCPNIRSIPIKLSPGRCPVTTMVQLATRMRRCPGLRCSASTRPIGPRGDELSLHWLQCDRRQVAQAGAGSGSCTTGQRSLLVVLRL